MSKKSLNIYKINSANFIVLLRILLIIVTVVLLCIENFTFRVLGLGTLLVAIILDYFDGYAARKLNITSKVGASLDMLGDRITENVMMVFFAYMHIFPLGLAIYFLIRAFISDFIRSLNYNCGSGVYDVNTSKLGYLFVASPLSRFLYLFAKTVLFVEGCLILILEVSRWADRVNVRLALDNYVLYTIYIVLIFNIIRFIYLIYDSRNTLKKHFS